MGTDMHQDVAHSHEKYGTTNRFPCRIGENGETKPCNSPHVSENFRANGRQKTEGHNKSSSIP